MSGYFRSSKKLELSLAAAIVGSAVVDIYCKFDGTTTQGCKILLGAAWEALELLHPVIFAACQALPVCSGEYSAILRYLFQFVTSLCPVLGALGCTHGGGVELFAIWLAIP
jgi:hypothetical protein